MQRLFELSNLTVAPFWLMMILAPRWRFTERVQRSLVGLLAPAAIYVLLVLPRLAEILPVVARPDLTTVSALLATPAGATIAWAHFLAFDLFVGRFIYLDARERGLSAWVVSPLLVSTLLLGPLGLLAYLMVRWLTARTRKLDARLAQGSTAFAAGSAPLVMLAIGSLGLLAASLILQLVDGRQVLGASTWLKPAKFAISVAITSATLAVLLRWLQPLTRGVRRAVGATTGLLVLELVIITAQAARGVPSHFNATSPLDTALFGVMGAAITVVWLALAYITWRAFRQPIADRAMAWGIRLGLVAMLVGSGLGFLMPRPTAAQLHSLQAGRPTAMIGAHAVGVEDGGPGVPITRWSTEGGDLRVAHFIGMHGLQLLPLVAWSLSRRRRSPHAARLTVVAGSGYLAFTLALLIQALRGQPLIAPDVWTVASLLAVAAATLAAAWLTTRRANAPSMIDPVLLRG
jgi:hypothetical protein